MYRLRVGNFQMPESVPVPRFVPLKKSKSTTPAVVRPPTACCLNIHKRRDPKHVRFLNLKEERQQFPKTV